MKNLALGFCSLRPVQLSEEVNDARENEYFISLQQLKRVLPDSFDLLLIIMLTFNIDDLLPYIKSSEQSLGIG